jgi:probable phosphoglycerate mutase
MNQLVQDDNVDNMILHGPELPPIAKGHKRLFLVRHGEVINPGGDKAVFYGALDVPLSELGKDEARAAGAYLHQFDLQHVAASPLSRAIFGAEEVIKRQLKDPSSKVKVYNGFTELDRGSWAMKTKEEIGIENLKRFDACDESITPDNGESYPQLKARVLMARDELLSITDDGRASAIVSHLQVTRSMLSDALRIPIKEMSKLKIATASITCIDYNIATGEQMIHFQSFKPEAGLEKAMDGAN